MKTHKTEHKEMNLTVLQILMWSSMFTASLKINIMQSPL